MFEYKFPDVGEGLSEGTLIKWQVKVGDAIKVDQTVAQVGTDKAVVDIPCPHAGVVSKLLYKEGDIVEVGKVFIVLDDESSSSNASTPNTTTQQTPNTKPAEAPEQKSVKLAKKNPQQSTQNNSTAVQQTQQSTTVTNANTSDIKILPSARKYAKENGINLSTITPTGPNGTIILKDVKSHATTVTQKIIEHEQEHHTTPHDILAAPSTRKYAREKGVDISKVTGTGPHGLISQADVDNYSVAPQKPVSAQSSQQSPSSVSQQLTSFGEEERVPFTRIRQIISQRMRQSRHTVAHVTVTDEVDVTELVTKREHLKAQAAKQNIKLTYLPFFIKACVVALKKFPSFNASLDEQNNELILKKYINVGFAADTPQGLLVPVIANADKKSIFELASDLQTLAQAAKENKLTGAQMQGGTFTITSVGSIGVEAFTPIINYPEVAILGIGKIADKAVVRDGQIVARKMATLSLSFDHRIVDGADAARFLVTIIEHMQDLDLLLAEMI